jgi:Icc-related predicted phosphoesterase
MKIWHISDLHLSAEDVTNPQELGDVPKADVAVILGDTSDNIFNSILWAVRNVKQHMPVIYVPGNHDFYWHELVATSARARQFSRRHGVLYLDGDTVILDGVRFLGAAFWSDFEIDAHVDGTPCDKLLAKSMEDAGRRSDFQRIYSNRRNAELIRPEDTRAVHLEHKRYFHRMFSRAFDGPTVALTHFAIHERSCDPKYRAMPGSSAYISNQQVMIERFQPQLWLHGHVHNHSEYQIGKTTVACNPFGYSHEATGYKWDYIHEV